MTLQNEIEKKLWDNFIDAIDSGLDVHFIGKDGVDLDDWVVALIQDREKKAVKYFASWLETWDIDVKNEVMLYIRTWPSESVKSDEPRNSEPAKDEQIDLAEERGYWEGRKDADKPSPDIGKIKELKKEFFHEYRCSDDWDDGLFQQVPTGYKEVTKEVWNFIESKILPYLDTATIKEETVTLPPTTRI